MANKIRKFKLRNRDARRKMYRKIMKITPQYKKRIVEPDELTTFIEAGGGPLL